MISIMNYNTNFSYGLWSMKEEKNRSKNMQKTFMQHENIYMVHHLDYVCKVVAIFTILERIVQKLHLKWVKTLFKTVTHTLQIQI